jgi:hypothetical protein
VAIVVVDLMSSRSGMGQTGVEILKIAEPEAPVEPGKVT